MRLFGNRILPLRLYDQRDLVRAVRDRLIDLAMAHWKALLQFDRVRLLWHNDELGIWNNLALDQADLQEFVLPGHWKLTRLAHDQNRLSILHTPGHRLELLDELIEELEFDGIHSFEDTSELIEDAKADYGNRTALLGGMDMDFLCSSSEKAIRKRVRNILTACMPGGGFCLGTGESLPEDLPIENFLTMLDEAKRFWYQT
jgi:uroporphyrinogen decarboxylase